MKKNQLKYDWSLDCWENPISKRHDRLLALCKLSFKLVLLKTKSRYKANRNSYLLRGNTNRLEGLRII